MKKGEQTKFRMLETAANLLQRHGYHGTGLSQILSDSGAPKGSLYFHFPGGKEELCATAAQRSGDAMRDQLTAVIDALDDPAEAIQRVFQFMGQLMVTTNYEVGCPLATLALEMAPYSDAIYSACSNSFKGMIGTIESRMTAAGIPTTKARGLSILLLSAMEGALLLSRALRSAEPMTTVGNLLSAQVKMALPS